MRVQPAAENISRLFRCEPSATAQGEGWPKRAGRRRRTSGAAQGLMLHPRFDHRAETLPALAFSSSSARTKALRLLAFEQASTKSIVEARFPPFDGGIATAKVVLRTSAHAVRPTDRPPGMASCSTQPLAVAGATPQPRIVTVPGKRGLNAFSNTDLDDLLERKGVTHVVLAGAVTSICIDSTGRAAHERGYGVTILSDCTAGRTNYEQEFYCDNIFPLYAETLTTDDFLARLT